MENMRFKVGDRVRIKSLDWYNKNKTSEGCLVCGSSHINPEMICMLGKIATISSVEGNHYRIKEYPWNWTDEMIEGLVEEENKPNIIEEAKTYWDSNKDAWICPEGYIFKDENGNIINAQKIVLEKKKKEYPKTYEECCKVLRYAYEQGITMRGVTEEEGELFRCLIVLKRCRDAYWKIVGEEMGLDGPWEPDFDNEHEYKYGLFRLRNIIYKDATCINPTLLIFPTEEMRDAFYENFKELIESCKELL